MQKLIPIIGRPHSVGGPAQPAERSQNLKRKHRHLILLCRTAALFFETLWRLLQNKQKARTENRSGQVDFS
jgi:hypothetical protein